MRFVLRPAAILVATLAAAAPVAVATAQAAKPEKEHGDHGKGGDHGTKDDKGDKGGKDKAKGESEQHASTTPATGNEKAARRPARGRSGVGRGVTGTVTVTAPGSTEEQPLVADAAVPFGATIDARHGSVVVATALPGGATQSARFSGGRFTLAQPKDGDGRVVIRMAPVHPRTACAAPAAAAVASSPRARVARKRRVLASLWVRDHHGRYRSHGRNSTAVVRGTVWVTRERCDGTFTYVRQGRVDVRDRRTGRVVHLRAGHGFLARRAR